MDDSSALVSSEREVALGHGVAHSAVSSKSALKRFFYDILDLDVEVTDDDMAFSVM